MKDDQTTVLSLNMFAANQPVASKTSGADSDTPTKLVAEAVRETVAEHPDAVILPKKQPSFPPRAMLGVVTYCYAKGVLSSSEIERKLWKDPRVVAACPAQIPEAHTIRKFRRLNREMILQALEKSLKRIRSALTRSTRTKTLYDLEKESKQVSPLGGDAPGEETIMIRREALDRLDHAARIDSTLRDD